jgi:L-aspartate oxidase
VLSTLAEQARQHPNITLLEDHQAVELITSARLGLPGQHCYGLHVLDVKKGQVITISAPHTVLATGGAGKAYLYTSNPDTSTGDGIAMAWRAGCRVANMEFVQFHPTCLYHPYAKSFLISEAVRGEGGILKLPNGHRFMPDHDPRAELAPRDIVARAIDFEIKRHGIDCVYLDISHQPAAFLQEHFPMILARCADFGIDMTKQGIPVVPAAHYTCGGIVTDMAGRTDLQGLYAVGETSYTGLHGANRLASNSLLECVVTGRSAAEAIEARGYGALSDALARASASRLPEWDESQVSAPEEEVVVAHNWDELRRLMWNYVGIVRSDKRLARARQRIALLRAEIDEYYANFKVSPDLLELRNLVDVASLIVDSAAARHESRGAHYSRDWPDTLPKALPTVLTPPKQVQAAPIFANKG